MRCWRQLLSVFCVLFILVTPLKALADDSVPLNILMGYPYYDPSACSGDNGPDNSDSSDAGSLTGDDNVAKAFNFFFSKNLLPPQAAGIVGNMLVEAPSKSLPLDIDPKATNGSHWGIAQWDAGRWANMKAYAARKGLDYNDIKAQLGFAWQEASSNSTIKDIKDTNTPEQAATVWEHDYENSGGQLLDQRIKYANQIFAKFKDSAPPPNDNTGGANNSGVDINSVVQKYHLQSAMIQEVGGSVVASYKADEPPTTPASTMKLVIADTVLRSHINLDQKINVTSDLNYAGSNDLGQSSVTIRDAMSAALHVSSNTGANVMMKALGGVSSFTDKAHSFGYTHTDVKGYYDPSNDGKNTSTISDEVTAMNHIFSSDAEGYQVAQDALQQASKDHNQYNVDDDANKWAGTSDVAGNVGKFKVGAKDYIIGLYYNGNYQNQSAQNAIKQGSSDLLGLVKDQSTNAAEASNAAAADCCPDAVTGTSGGGDSNGADSGVWDSGLSAPYVVEQYAIEVLKDLAKKKGVDESKAVTKEHVLALVAWVRLEGGDINNNSLFNLYNTGKSAPELNDGPHTGNGLGSYKSFDAGVEATARTLAQKDKSGMSKALLDPDTKAIDFGHAESYSGTDSYPGTALWAEAAHNNPAAYEAQWKNILHQVRADYKSTAGLVIGTPEKEFIANKTDPSKVQYDGDNSASVDDSSSADCSNSGSTSADAAGVVQTAVKLSWPNDSHGAEPNPAYREAFTKYDPNGSAYADCGTFVSTVMRASGADPNYPPSGTALQAQYVKSHSDKYDVVDKVNSTADLQPGDILIVNQGSGQGASGHTLIYVGKQPNGFDAASASLGSRAGNLGNVVFHDYRGDYIRARLK